eukprot:c23378_g1_i2 orf=325-3057(+)
MQKSLVACTPYFCRSFTGGIIEKSKDEIPQSKLRRLLAVCEGKPWDANIEEALGGYSKELTKTLVFKAVRNMEPDSAKGFFKWAGKQEGYEHGTYLHNVLFRNFLRAHKFESAIEVLQEMKENDIAINPKSFNTLAHYYVKAGMMTEAEETIEVLKSFGFSPSPKLYRVLLGGYLQASDEEGADRLLQNLSGVEDFNAAISVYAEAGKAELALKVLDSMEKVNCLANVRTYDLLVSGFSKANMIDEALKSLENMQEKSLLPDVNIYNTIISHLLQENRVDEALKLLSNMKDNGCQPDIRTHVFLINSYLNSGQTEKAQLQLKEMKADGYVPTRETLKLFDAVLGKSEEVEKEKAMPDLSARSKKEASSLSQQKKSNTAPHEELKEGKRDSKVKRILDICRGKSWDADTEEALSIYSKELTHKLVHKLLQSMDADLAKAFFRWAENQEGYAHSRHEYNVLFRIFLRAGKFDSAVEILKEMKYKDLEFDTKCFASLVHYYGKAGMMREAEEAVDMMKSFGLNQDAKLYGVLLNGYLQANEDESAMRLLQDFSGIEDFNAAISAYARAGKADSALKAVEIMHEKGCPANVQTYDLLVRCLCRAEMIEEALKVLEEMQEKDLVLEVRVYNTLISYYCQKKRVDEALKLISRMKEFGCRPNIITHNSLITGYLKLRQVEKARQHVEEMKAEGCMPTHETSRLFVVNLCMAEEVDKAMQEFTAAVDNEQKLSPDACNSLLKGLIKDGKLDEALKTFKRMKVGGCPADISTYIVLLRGCCNLCRFDVIDQLLAEVRTKSLQLPVSTFVVLLQTYSRAKKFKEVVTLFEELQESGQDCAGANTSTAVLDALSRAHQLDIGVKFCEYLENSGSKVNARQLKYFFRLLVKAGRAGEATELMKAMSEKGCVIPEKSQLQAA